MKCQVDLKNIKIVIGVAYDADDDEGEERDEPGAVNDAVIGRLLALINTADAANSDDIGQVFTAPT